MQYNLVNLEDRESLIVNLDGDLVTLTPSHVRYHQIRDYLLTGGADPHVVREHLELSGADDRASDPTVRTSRI